MESRPRPKPTHELVLESLSYDPDSGAFKWRQPRQGRRHDRAGGKQGDGYLYIKIREYGAIQAHRLAWFYVHGAWPEGEIDHINGDKLDNRLANLRDVSRTVNEWNKVNLQANNTSGFRGVCFDKSKGKFVALIQAHGKITRLGLFASAEEAGSVYLNAKASLHA